eukprot:7086751-Prymnesium_polylepis.1
MRAAEALPSEWEAVPPPAEAPAEWMYVDDLGAQQGPFPTAKLRSWLARGLLTIDRKVRPASGGADDLRPMVSYAELVPPELAAPAAAAGAGGAAAGVNDTAAKPSEWVYIDDNGAEQGPFPTAKLI